MEREGNGEGRGDGGARALFQSWHPLLQDCVVACLTFMRSVLFYGPLRSLAIWCGVRYWLTVILNVITSNDIMRLSFLLILPCSLRASPWLGMFWVSDVAPPNVYSYGGSTTLGPLNYYLTSNGRVSETLVNCCMTPVSDHEWTQYT